MTGWRFVQYADLGHAPVAVGVGGAARPTAGRQTGSVANDPAHADGIGWDLCISFVASDPWTGARDSLYPGTASLTPKRGRCALLGNR